jgi:predicted membrane channel-forming protein YqfA (hemolysin III family)
MSKKLILLLITLITFTNVSYASFPVDTNKTDTTQVVVKETTEQYHLRMEKQGFDISNCMCESCRHSIPLERSTTVNSRSSNSLYKIAAILFALALIVFVVWMLDGVACIEDSSTCASNTVPLIFYVSLLMLFGYSSIFYFIKGLLIQKRNK